MTEIEAIEQLFNTDLNAPDIKRRWGRLFADIRREGIAQAVENLEHEINLQQQKESKS